MKNKRACKLTVFIYRALQPIGGPYIEQLRDTSAATNPNGILCRNIQKTTIAVEQFWDSILNWIPRRVRQIGKFAFAIQRSGLAIAREREGGHYFRSFEKFWVIAYLCNGQHVDNRRGHYQNIRTFRNCMTRFISERAESASPILAAFARRSATETFASRPL